MRGRQSGGDESSNRNTAVLSEAGWRTEGKFGSAATFNGATSFGEAADIDAISPQTEATFQAWVSLDAAPSDLASVFKPTNVRIIKKDRVSNRFAN
jgi:hypothetical protein